MIANRVRMSKVDKGWDGIFADPEVGRVLHAKGKIADANKSSIEELATITSLNPTNDPEGSYFYKNEVITQFPELKYCTGLTSLYQLFRGCTSLTTAPVIPNSVTDLRYTFNVCSSLLEAPIIPEGVTNMQGTFYDCSGLTTAPVIPSSVTNLTRTFYGCLNIRGIYIINIVTPVSYAISLSNVQAIYVPDASVSAYKSASGWRNHSSKIYPMSDMSDMEGDIVFADPEVGRVLKLKGLIVDPVKSSKRELATIKTLNPSNEHTTSYFYNNKVITQFPELQYCTGLTSLRSAFNGCSSLTTVGDIIPEGVTNMQATFMYCSSLTKAPTIPEGVTTLNTTFSRCSNLTTAPVIPEGVTDLRVTFYLCSRIDGVYIINAVTPPTYNDSLSNTRVIYVPDASVQLYKSASGWSEFADKIYPMSTKP